MTLKEARKGKKEGFSIFPEQSKVVTIGPPEKYLWSSINHLCAHDIIKDVLRHKHKINDKSNISLIANNMKLYIQQAYEFYEAARFTKPNTAPLFYYYCFLNLSKALIEIKNPNFYMMRENRNHGIGRKRKWGDKVDLEKEFVIIYKKRGVWHMLLETISGKECPELPDEIKLPIKHLFGLCPEISDEYSKTFNEHSRHFKLQDPLIMQNKLNKERWIKFTVDRDNFKELNYTKKEFINMISSNDSKYHQVKSKYGLTFEFKKSIKYDDNQERIFETIGDEFNKLNVFTTLHREGLSYSIPVKKDLQIELPQILVLYSILFLLGSLVRYDPHKVSKLQDSKYWILIDGFLNQSRIWLLYLLEWQFYQEEKTLQSAR